MKLSQAQLLAITSHLHSARAAEDARQLQRDLEERVRRTQPVRNDLTVDDELLEELHRDALVREREDARCLKIGLAIGLSVAVGILLGLIGILP